MSNLQQSRHDEAKAGSLETAAYWEQSIRLEFFDFNLHQQLAHLLQPDMILSLWNLPWFWVEFCWLLGHVLCTICWVCVCCGSRQRSTYMLLNAGGATEQIYLYVYLSILIGVGQTYQALLVLSPQSEQNQGFLTGDQKVSAHRAAGHSDGTLRQRHLNDLHLHSTPHRRSAQEVA